MRILIVEDDLDMQSILKQVLEAEKFTVDSCSSGEESFLYLDVVHYDLCLIDLELPGMDGKELIKSIREKKIDSPIIIISARQQLEERISGLDMGADDYLVKPFELEELLARIRANLRRDHHEFANVIKVKDLSIDLKTHQCRKANRLLALTGKEYKLLEFLMLNKNIVISRESLLSHVWGFDYEGGSNIVDVYINFLRKKIDGKGTDSIIQTVRGQGYIIIEE